MILELMAAAVLVNLQAPDDKVTTVEVDEKLTAIYEADNKMYWRGKLPNLFVGWGDLGDANAMTYWLAKKPQAIVIDKTLKGNNSVVACALIHEETHVRLGPNAPGAKFTRTMMDVVRRGGCAGLFRHQDDYAEPR